MCPTGHRDAHLDTLPVELQRLLSEIDPDRRLGVFQESAPAESVRQTRLPHVRVSYDDNLQHPGLRGVAVALRGEPQGVVLTEDDVEVLTGLVFYCHRSCSRHLDVSDTETSREQERT